MNENTSNTIQVVGGIASAAIALAFVLTTMVGCQKEKDAGDTQKELARIELQRAQVQRDVEAQRAFADCTAQQAVEKCFMIFGRK